MHLLVLPLLSPFFNKTIQIKKHGVLGFWGFGVLARPRGKQGDKGLIELKKDLLVGSEAVWRATQATWWNWDGGSTIYFWRWPTCYRSSVRDGAKAFVHRNKLPS